MNAKQSFQHISLFLLIFFGFPNLVLPQFSGSSWRDKHIENKMRFHKLAAANIAAETPNQKLFDVHSYRISLRIDPQKQWVNGKVNIQAKIVRDSLQHLELELGNHLQIDSIRFSQQTVTHLQTEETLLIILNTTLHADESLDLTIFYQGNPAAGDRGGFHFDSFNSKPLIWSLSEPFGARDWWPCKDTPADKADSVDIIITVPEPLIVASNGNLVNFTGQDGWRTFHWQERYPITTYLVSVAIYEYFTYSEFFNYSATDSMEIQYYVFPEHQASVRENFAQTLPAMAIFTRLFGPYPFLKEKYGHAEFGWGGGMEHQTITSLGSWSVPLIVHELAHQWWGDMITCRDFHHIWLNEGFATYSEALYWEATLGREAYLADMLANRYLMGGSIYVQNLSDRSRIFHGGLSYAKGAWVLHMLRHVVGDSAFFRILHEYAAAPELKYGTAVTEDFQTVCEDVTGESLRWFFQQWIYGEFYPAYFYQWTAKKNQTGNYQVNLEIEQHPIDNYLFKMPIDIFIHTAVSETTIVVWDSLKVQNFEFELSARPLQVELDPDKWILKEAYRKSPRPLGPFLEQSFPNPICLAKTNGAENQTIIGYQINQTSHVRLTIYNMLGQMVRKLVDRPLLPQYYTTDWDGRNEDGNLIAAGIYLYELQTDYFRDTKKMLVLR